MSLTLHIISFNVPYPADYGGVIDVFNKVKALHRSGVKIILHCFEYGRERDSELEKYCEKVFYYTRKAGFLSTLSFLPYIIYSRRSDKLLKNLKADKHPVLFEGLHTTYLLCHKDLKNRVKIVRMHNIEHRYYFRLFSAAKTPSKKLFFLVETLKLIFAERRLGKADLIAAISISEKNYFQQKFGNTILLNAFHSNNTIEILPGRGEYILYHGNLSVPENQKAINYLANKVFSRINFPVVIAGKNPGSSVQKLAGKFDKITIVASPGDKKMKELIKHAQVIVMISFQDTGIKLKLIESLFTGRHCVINSFMAGKSGLDEICETGNTPAELIIQVKKVLDTEFDQVKVDTRRRFLLGFDNQKNADLLIQSIKRLI